MERYSRNTLIQNIGTEGQKKLLASKVLICGAGGLGSTVIANLASMGIGFIGIIDNDKLELSNLNRQYIHKFANIGVEKTDSAKQWINQYNSEVNVKTYNLRLTEDFDLSILTEYDLIMDCFDSYESKFTLNKLCSQAKKPLIHGGVTEFYGQVMTIIPEKTACLNCLFPNPDPHAYVIKGVVSPSVSLIASLQSMETLKYLLNIGELITDKILSYNALKQEFKQIKFKKNLNCSVCAASNVML